ncbi:MAG: type II secretion system F family protein [Deltaproteobacteria bacterium]|nr:type II secretion system F family protein [Deltaproteobacteria bacterium]
MMTSLTDMPILTNVLIFSAIFLFCMGANQFLRERSAREFMVQKIKNAGIIGLDEQHEETVLNTDNRIAGAVARIGSAVFPVKDEDYSQISRARFLRAGYRQANAPAVYWGIKLLLAFLLPIFIFVCRIFFFSTMTYQWTMMLLIFSALFGYYLPDIWLRQKSDQRKESILHALPDALDLLVICVEAGIGIDSALQRVSQEIAFTFPELSDELRFANLELRAGKSRHDALRNLALRTNLIEIDSLVTLLIQTDKFGTSISSALRVFSESYRTERIQKAEEQAAVLPVKMLLPLTVFIFPSLFVVLLGPAAISIYKMLIIK